MELSELTAYASEKYQIQEQYKWADFPGFSVLCHPKTGKWVALLMRQWDGESGKEIERCDLKCGADSLRRNARPYLSYPIRMHGGKWIGIAFDERTESQLVFALFDQAMQINAPSGFTIVLGSQLPAGKDAYQDTALPFAASSYQPPREKHPERLREMRRMYDYGSESEGMRAKNFYNQAVFMQDYEDDVLWTGDFVRYFPTYHDLTTMQLRGYFTWRAQVRKGNYQPIAASAAYIYLYELLNGVGAASPQDVLIKLQDFEKGYLDSGIGDSRMRAYLRRWMLEYAVLNDLPPETARRTADSAMIEKDRALAVLRAPETYDDEAVFCALCAFGGKRIADSPVIAVDAERGKHLFSAVWRLACACDQEEKGLFALCFGEKKTRRWYPLANAVYYERSRPKDREYVLDESRSYRCKNGLWQVTAYEALFFDRARFQGLLHQADARLRRYLKTGRYLKEKPADAWAVPFVDAVIEADKKALLEAARPKITIDLSGLEKIRLDAAGTRDSLLTEAELEEAEPAAEAAPEPTDSALDALQTQILRALLAGKDAAPMIQAHHLLPSIVADFINESLFDEIGDTVVLCEGDKLSIVDDYIEDIEKLLGGN